MNWFKKFWKGLAKPTPGVRVIMGTAPIPVETSAPMRHTSRTVMDSQLSNFTPRAQQVLKLAGDEANRLNHNFLGTEHLLLGLIKLGQGVAVNVLIKLGMDLETTRAEVEKQVGTGPDQKTFGRPPYTPRVKKAMALAQLEAKSLNHTYVGTEHLLLGLLREGDGVAARVMQALGLDIERTRREILRELDPNFTAENQPAKETSALPPKTNMSTYHAAQSLDLNLIDTGKRYDVYCNERGQELVMYRNARFKGTKKLFPSVQSDIRYQFIELEQADGQSIFILRLSLAKFCEHGVTPQSESVANQKPEQ